MKARRAWGAAQAVFLALSGLALAVPQPAHAGSLAPQLCDLRAGLNAAQQDRLLRFAAIAKEAFQASGAEVALLARSGLNLQRFGVRYSHAGVSLRAGALGAWSVRQLYMACDEGRPRVFDQGLGGFVAGTDDPQHGYLSALLLPADAGRSLQRAALHGPLALGLLATDYSANAYAYGLRYQNCNQWLVELLATAWGGLWPEDGALVSAASVATLALYARPAAQDAANSATMSAAPAQDTARSRAQRWLAARGYEPAGVAVNSQWLMLLAPLLPWVHLTDHPEADRQAQRLRTSLPADIEAWVHEVVPQAQRIEICHAQGRVVLRRGWVPIEDGCVPAAGDEVTLLD